MLTEEGGDGGLGAVRRGPTGLLGPLGWRTPPPLRGTPDLRRSRATTATRSASSTALIGSFASRRWLRLIISWSSLARVRLPPAMCARTLATSPTLRRSPDVAELAEGRRTRSLRGGRRGRWSGGCRTGRNCTPREAWDEGRRAGLSHYQRTPRPGSQSMLPGPGACQCRSP